MTRYDAVPPRAGHACTAAAWRWDPARNRYRLQQAHYESRQRKVKDDSPAKVGRSALAAEQRRLNR